ncbi:putative quinol monooxygenase [Kordiimonas lacus]|uniref:Quinol monooxygenase YgiN n=1 Tax=Kordiimonas lacus TaxID=637679 RepID=A0A1G6Y7V6_9PROT|nr:putative quinol monooxygenase [Kordiimonas lacus]SDD86351.1 Quinol monooxygenase YgiN [Kordiimonas lacus]
MIVVTGLIKVAPENRILTIAAARMLMRHSRKEPGNATYQFYEDIDDPATFRFYEEWYSKQALMRHIRADYTVEFRRALARFGVLSIDIQRFDTSQLDINEQHSTPQEPRLRLAPLAY